MKKSYAASLFSLSAIFVVVLFSFPELASAIWLPEQFPGVSVNNGGMVLGVTTGPDTLSGNQLLVTGEAYIAGKLGIGAKDPIGKLDVNGNVYILSNGRYYSFGGAKLDGAGVGNIDPGVASNDRDGSFAIRDAWVHRDRLRIDISGNIELGNRADLGVRRPADVTVFGTLYALGDNYNKNTKITGGKVVIDEQLTVGTTTVGGNFDMPSSFFNGLQVFYNDRYQTNLSLNVTHEQAERGVGVSINFQGSQNIDYGQNGTTWSVGTDRRGDFYIAPTFSLAVEGMIQHQNDPSDSSFWRGYFLNSSNRNRIINMPAVNLNLSQGTVTAKNICTTDGVCLGTSTNAVSTGNGNALSLSGSAQTFGSFVGGEGNLFRSFSVQCPTGQVMVGMNVRQNITQYYFSSGSIRDNYQFQPICQ